VVGISGFLKSEYAINDSFLYSNKFNSITYFHYNKIKQFILRHIMILKIIL